jgi:molybdate transport system substrate-binding protein
VKRIGAVAAAAVLTLTVACGAYKGDLLVFAASSLKETFTKIGADFERRYHQSHVRFNFGSSDGLAGAIAQGARVDVFATASQATMEIVNNEPGVSASVFARNTLVVITPKDSRVSSLLDLVKPGVKLVVGAATVPAGKYARQMLEKAGLQRAMKNIVSNEIDVKGVVQKVVLGEADAGIVYVTDVTPTVARSVRTVPIPDQVNVIATYPIGLVTPSRLDSGSGAVNPHATLARAFVRYVLGPGQAVLRAAGFLPPSA